MGTKQKKDFDEKLSEILVNTYLGKRTLSSLVKSPGVAKRVVYYNNIEVKGDSINDPFKVIKKEHDYGLIFNSNIEFPALEIRHVSKSIFNYFGSLEIIERRERV